MGPWGFEFLYFRSSFPFCGLVVMDRKTQAHLETAQNVGAGKWADERRKFISSKVQSPIEC